MYVVKRLRTTGLNFVKATIAEIKARGQLTIPKKIREMSHLEEGQVVSIIPVGDSLIITPKRLELDEARREIKKILKASQLSPEDLLAGLKEERKDLYKEKYGKKKA
jgi:AbrB family looped-hinge helix DNA binding protein